MESTYEEIQASVFCNKIRKMEMAIDNNLNEIKFENLSVEQFALIYDSMNVANDIICMIIKNQQN